jgi:hypothetical protein
MIPGDIAYISDMSRETRSYFMVGSLNPPVGTVIDMPVRRADGLHHIYAKFLPSSFLSGNTTTVTSVLAIYGLTLLMAALGLLLLWRGNSTATLGVAIICLTGVLQTVLSIMPWPMPYSKFIGWASTIVQNLGTIVGLYLVADNLTAAPRSWARRRFSMCVFIAVAVYYLLSVVFYNLNFYLTGNNNGFGIYSVIGAHFAGFVIPLSILIFSYRRCDPVNKARIRWMLFSLVGLLAGYTLEVMSPRLQLSVLAITVLGTVIVAAAFVGFAYATLRHRLVSLQFVLNRALVYGLITSLVVGVFAAMLSFLEHEALNTMTNRTLALIVPLLLGMGLNSLKRNVDEYINKIFFRNRHKAEEALAQFARTSAFVENPETLLDLTADELSRHGGCQSLAIYLTEPGKAGAKLMRQRGEGTYPQHLDIDDLGLLRLRAGDLEVDLHGVSSGLGKEGNVFAFSVRGQVLGFIVCGPRPGEAYSPEERKLFALVAHQVAVALHSLRLEEEHRLLKALAEGSFNSLPMAQAKAKELIRAVG